MKMCGRIPLFSKMRSTGVTAGGGMLAGGDDETKQWAHTPGGAPTSNPVCDAAAGPANTAPSITRTPSLASKRILPTSISFRVAPDRRQAAPAHRRWLGVAGGGGARQRVAGTGRRPGRIVRGRGRRSIRPSGPRRTADPAGGPVQARAEVVTKRHATGWLRPWAPDLAKGPP